jgi:DNA-binding MarR family transcriptional regulator
MSEPSLYPPERSESPAEAIRAALNRKELAAARQRAALARLFGLSETDVLAIQHLALAGRLTASQLGARLRMTSGGSTALVQRLERESCVVREPHPHDRRSTLLRLTPRVQQRAGDALAPLVREIDTLSERLPDGQRAAVAALLGQIADAAERHADELTRRAEAAARSATGSPVPGLWA